ncbi:hypothetical protein PTKIN_Ptkin13bG0095100 [Pterospermum kingtungense]
MQRIMNLSKRKSLDALLGSVTSKVGKRYAFTGFEALKEPFISKFLPDQKLKTLLQRPVNELPEAKDGYFLLVFWYWEDCLKQRYERFVIAIEEASRDMLPALKDKALKGVNRAFPYVSSNKAGDVVDIKTPILFQMVVSDQFYRALYSKLVVPAAMNSSKASRNVYRTSSESLFKTSIAEETDTEPSPRLASKRVESNADIHGAEVANFNNDSSKDGGVLPCSYSHDDASDDAEELFIRGNSEDLHKPKPRADQNALKPQISFTWSFDCLEDTIQGTGNLPTDCASWWELMVLSTHVHPSYHHGLDPSVKNEFLKETERNNKKKHRERGARELFNVGGNDIDGDYVEGIDESDKRDNEEIENLLDSAHPSLDADGEYDYDDLNQVANEDDDDLIGNASDAEVDLPLDDTDIGDAYDLSNDEDGFHQ